MLTYANQCATFPLLIRISCEKIQTYCKIAVSSAATDPLLTAEGGEIFTYCIRQYLLPMVVAEQSAKGHILVEHWCEGNCNFKAT